MTRFDAPAESQLRETTEQIREKIQALRCLEIGMSFTPEDRDWLCDKLAQALDRIGDIEGNHPALYTYDEIREALVASADECQKVRGLLEECQKAHAALVPLEGR